jgi:large subunit ribosomal protein L23
MQYTIKRPLITEKNSWLAEKGVYVFEVDTKAEKPEIKKAIEKSFSVKVASVRTAVCRGRSKKNRQGVMSTPTKWKKAWVCLEPGQKIGLFEGA